MHSIDQVNVHVTGRPEDHAIARSGSRRGMGRIVVRAQVGFGFDDAARFFSVNQNLAQQIARYFNGRPGVERTIERSTHYMSSLPLTTIFLRSNLHLMEEVPTLLTNSISPSSATRGFSLEKANTRTPAPLPVINST